MPALLATLIFSALATIPSTAPGFVPASVPGTIPANVPAAPSVGVAVVPGPAIYVTPAGITPNFVPSPLLTPTAAGFLLGAPASLPVVVASTPGVVPALVPGTQPAILPVTVLAVPGVVPGAVPGFVPALVAPGAPQPAPLVVPSAPTPSPVPVAPIAPTSVVVAAATGIACASCSAGAGTTNYNGRTLAWTRTCAACAITTTFISTFSSTGCSGLTGTDAADCCRAGLRDSICGVPALGRPATCTCLGSVIACPGCSSSKKGLLGLLGLLGLIPLLLCLSLLSCLFWLCCIRGTKKGPETHFATYQPQAAAVPTVVQTCAPEVLCAPAHCDAGYLPSYGCA